LYYENQFACVRRSSRVARVSRRDKAAKTATAQDLWVPAVNNHGGFGRWGFIEISNPRDAANTIRGYIASRASDG
jgi:type III restriction enzyme